MADDHKYPIGVNSNGGPIYIKCMTQDLLTGTVLGHQGAQIRLQSCSSN